MNNLAARPLAAIAIYLCSLQAFTTQNITELLRPLFATIMY